MTIDQKLNLLTKNNLEREIRVTERKYRLQLDICTKLGVNLDDMRVKTSFRPERTDDQLTKLAQIKIDLDELKGVEAQMARLFKELPDSKHRVVMDARYIQRLSWRGVEKITGYSDSWAKALGKQATDKLKEIVGEEEVEEKPLNLNTLQD